MEHKFDPSPHRVFSFPTIQATKITNKPSAPAAASSAKVRTSAGAAAAITAPEKVSSPVLETGSLGDDIICLLKGYTNRLTLTIKVSHLHLCSLMALVTHVVFLLFLTSYIINTGFNVSNRRRNDPSRGRISQSREYVDISRFTGKEATIWTKKKTSLLFLKQ